MEASTLTLTLSYTPDSENIKRRLLRKGVIPTPKIVHTIRKKETQKSIRKSKKLAEKTLPKPFTESQKQLLEEESRFQTIKREYREVKREFTAKPRDQNEVLMVGKPWERLERSGLREISSGSKEYVGERLKVESLKELGEILAQRKREDSQWLLDDDIEEGDWMESSGGQRFRRKREIGDDDKIRFIVNRLSTSDYTMQDWKFSKVMKQTGLHFTERHLLKIVGELGAVSSWRHALSVVNWVYTRNEYKHRKSRFVYTKLLAVLGKARRTKEALHVFNQMRKDCQIYPDMAAYRNISVTLGQAGFVKELMNLIECMGQKPSSRNKNMQRKNWDPRLEPDVVIFNAVLNACVPSQQWKGVSWVMEQMRKLGIKPNGATYGLAMEVMLQSGKFDLVHVFFGKMKRSGIAPNALTYRVLVKTFWEEGNLNEAINAVRSMEQRGVVGAASVYYELACCLCKNGRWKEAMMEVEKLKKCPLTKPLEVTFTGMIMSCMDGRHVDDCTLIFEQMKDHCSPNIGTINAMLKVYGRNDMFDKAKELFEETKSKDFSFNTKFGGGSLTPDAYTYSLILEASSSAHQWEFFEYVYKEMALNGYELDQNKHAWLLVEASKAGKGHLLEHAFDMILEAGDIPPLAFFTEMVCQTTARHDYERAVSFVNVMAHASFQVSESQWTDIFLRCRDRICDDGLQKLLDTLCNSEVVSEPTVSNLSKSLKSICRSSSPSPEEYLAVITSGDTPGVESTSGDSNGVLYGERSGDIQNCSMDTLDEIETPMPEMSVIKNDNVPAAAYPSESDAVDDIDISSRADSSSHLCENKSTSSDHDGDGVEDGRSNPILDRDLEDNMEETLDFLISRNSSSGSGLPSGSEIIDEWQKGRNKDGIFFGFSTLSAKEHASPLD